MPGTQASGYSLYSGAGGMDLGFEQAGVQVSGGCEIDGKARETWARNFKGHLPSGGADDVAETDIGRGVDILFGGPPCQGYSVAGKMDPDDPRSAQVFTFMRAVQRWQPAAFVMENVEALGLLSVWSAVRDRLSKIAAAAGFETATVVLDASRLGVPQARKRMFMLGFRRQGLAAEAARRLVSAQGEPMPVRPVLMRLGPAGTEMNPKTSTAKITFAVKPVMRKYPYAGMLFNGAGRPINPSRPSPTLAASAGGNKTHIVDEDQVFGGQEAFIEAYHRHLCDGGKPHEGTPPSRLRRLTLRESAAIQGFPDGFVFAGETSSVYRQIGNAVPPPLARAVAQEVLRTLWGSILKAAA
jgi:DNA (cytosine-5)-methyltransferase 1